ncbi:CPBP family intramembrane glutamic endopeptidase [Epilithonimonas sp.]|uniref:CPBP family intramembrane glutamic endopeptidase n=1 Tax=Epilithonimonas sp. TaxID=2894511 RepID=UPI002FDD997E
MISQFFSEWREEIKSLLVFLKNPHQNFDRKYSFFEKQRTITALFLLEVAFTFILVFPLNYLIGKVYHIRYIDDLANFSILEIILLGVFIIPFIEEIFFRLPLKYKRNYLFKFFDLFTKNKFFEHFWNSNYRFFFYFFVITFGLLHASNYENKITATFLIVSFFITLSQLSGGLVMGYLRLKFGFIWGYIYHIIWNFVFLVGSYLLYHNTILIDFKTTDTIIKLEYLSSTEGQPYIYKDIENDTIYEMKITNSDFQYLLNEVAPKYHSDEVHVINLDIESKKGISRKKLFRILKHKIQIDSIRN